MQSNPISRAYTAWGRSTYPLTQVIIALNVLTFLLSLSNVVGVALAKWTLFTAPYSLQMPWTLFTYPLVTLFPNIVGLLFNGLVLWWFGGSLERGWGTKTFALFFGLISVVTALSLCLGSWIINMPIPVTQWLPTAALILAWCTLNPRVVIYLYGLIPVQARWLAVGEVLIIFFLHASTHPILGFLALSGCGVAYWWSKTRSWSNEPYYPLNPRYSTPDYDTPRAAKSRRRVVPRDDRRTLRDLNPLEWIARRRRKKQFERLMRDD